MQLAMNLTRTDAGKQLKLFLAMSRTPHGLIDMTTPVFAALLWLGGLPPAPVALLGLITAFAGYTAVYALNDIVDLRSDRAQLCREPDVCRGQDIDALLVRHPMARGLLSLRSGLIWALGWALVALAGAYLLNPVCALIFAAGCLLEAFYCLLLHFSWLRVFVSGVVKTLGALAAVFAVDPHPSPSFLGALGMCLFFWEIGGQNIPNDWSDVEEDRCQDACTLPVRIGPERAAVLIVVFLFLAVAESAVLFWLAPAARGMADVAAAAAVGVPLLIWPSVRLLRVRTRARALKLFNRASYYPAALLLIVVVRMVS